MKDFFGRNIIVGDEVAYHTGGRYGDLKAATVTGFTSKRVKIEFPSGTTTNCVANNLILKNPRTD